MELNPILLEIFKNRFISIAEEMGAVLYRTAFSPNIKERKDSSCAVFDEKGDMIAQAAHIPVHLGSMPLSVKSAIKNIDFCEGDMVILNDPYKGGTHIPDITIISPIFIKGEEGPQFFVANRAHHSDVGGKSSGSMPLSTEIFQEGLIIPPLKIVEKGEIDYKLMALILNNVRTKKEREGDFSAQFMANNVGSKRLHELIQKYTLSVTKLYAQYLMDYSEKIMRDLIYSMKDGLYNFYDFLDDDGQGSKDIKIDVSIKIDRDNVILDFTKSSKEVQGNVNAVYSITLSAVLYVFRSLISTNIVANAGCLRPIKVVTEKGSIVDCNFPAAVAAGNVETSQRIVDVVLGALSKVMPDHIPAASQGTMNNITIGGLDWRNNEPFTYYETIGGGMGAAKDYNGASAVHSHMTNTLNTPVEALEFSYPLQVIEYSIRRGSGGKGKFKGGDGIIRDIKTLVDAELTVLSERRRLKPYGLFGGEEGLEGKNIIIENGTYKQMPSKFNVKLKKGSRVRIETPGGGGFGSN
ncbi:MAG: hydantoinase B/oxoprolinase family protein [Deferribacterota bacterium]|nr:hydantoinase B/oxoprolinase family protein [Deferribacterota bacterium]